MFTLSVCYQRAMAIVKRVQIYENQIGGLFIFANCCSNTYKRSFVHLLILPPLNGGQIHEETSSEGPANFVILTTASNILQKKKPRIAWHDKILIRLVFPSYLTNTSLPVQALSTASVALRKSSCNDKNSDWKQAKFCENEKTKRKALSGGS